MVALTIYISFIVLNFFGGLVKTNKFAGFNLFVAGFMIFDWKTLV